MTEKRTFLPPFHFQASTERGYLLLPFSFLHLDDGQYFLSNLVGEYLILTGTDLDALVRHKIPMHSTVYNNLKSKHFLMDESSTVALDLMAAKYRTKLRPVSNFTGLHIFVITIRCNNQCTYCQVSSLLNEKNNYDMTERVADKAVEFMFQSPSPYLKVEFQGGEPLLNFKIIQHIVLQVEELNQVRKRDVEFVICTNLSLLTVEMIRFIDEHGIYISTSLDGPEDLHNINRPNPSKNSYRLTVENIRKLQEVVGPNRVSALMTTTRESLKQPERIVDEYLSLRFKSIFVRPLNPYGREIANKEAVSYDVDSWLQFYKKTLDYIIAVNVQGVFFREDLASIVLKKMLTPYGTGFVDLQSPQELVLESWCTTMMGVSIHPMSPECLQKWAMRHSFSAICCRTPMSRLSIRIS